MESDLSLIEIAGEDDSLLQQIPNDDVSSLSTKRDDSATDFFICSPLQVSRSNPIEDMIGSSCSDSLNKENLRANKAELPKLSVERQQMKRKKKGAYNLRKSLAWDRAFFTEEGILNSEELSLINGSFSKSSGESLSSIQEEDPLYDSSDLQALEDKLFKEVPKAASNKDKKAAPSSAARRKVLSAHDVNISGSKRSGCPRPVASPSLKRPANLVTTKAAVKESRVPKFSVTKPDPFVASRTLKSATVGDSKQNLTARPVDNQKKLGTKGSSNNTRIAPNNSKPVPAGKSLPTKTSLGQARRNVPKSEKCLRTIGLSPLTTEANNGLEGISKQSLPSPGFSSNAHDGGSRKTALPLSQNASSTGLNMQHIQLPKAKPSGLRMPSPSLAFFDQSKRNSHSSSLPESNIPNLRKHDFQNPVSKLRPPLPSVSVSKVVNDKAPMGNIKASCLSSGSSVISAVNPALHEIGKTSSQLTNMQDGEHKVQYDQNSFQAIRIRQQSHSIAGDVDKTFVGQEGQCITKSSSQIEDLKLQRNDKNILLQGETGPKLNKHDNGAKVVDDNKDTERSESQNPPCLTSHSSSVVEITNLSEKDDATKKLLAEDKPCNPLFKNPGISSELNSENGNLSLTSYSEVHGDLSSREHFVNEPFEEQAEMRTCNIDLISNVDQMLQVNSSDDFSKKGGGPEDTSCSEPLGEKANGGQILRATTDDFSLKCGGQEEPQNHSCTEVADITSKVQDCNGDESETSYASSHSTSMEKGKYGFKVEDKVGSTSNEEDSEMQSLAGHIEVERSNHNLRTLEDDQHIMIVGNVNEKSEHLEFPNSSVTRDHVFDDEVHIEDSALVVNSNFHEESKQENLLHSDKPEGVGACESESKSSGALCEIPVVTLDCVSNGAELVECQMLEDTPSVSVSRETAFFHEESKQGNILHSDKPEGQGVGACESESKGSGALCEIPVVTLDCGSNGAELVECQMLEDTPSVSVSKETAVFHEESKQGNILHSDKPEGVGACGSESESSGALCEIPVVTLHCGSNGAELVECQMLEDTPSVSVSREAAVFHEESKQGNILHSDKPEGQGVSACESESKGSGALCEIAVVTLDRGSNGAELVECQMLEDTPSVSVSKETAIFQEESKQGNILHSGKPEGVGACESESKSSGALCAIPVVTLDRGSNRTELVDCQMLEDTPLVSVNRETDVFHEESKQENILHSDKPEGVGACEIESKSSGSLCEIPVTLDRGSNGSELVVCQMLEDMPSVSVSRETAIKNYNPDTSVHYMLFEDSQSLEESRKFNNVNSANDDSKLGVCDGSGLESSCILSPHEHMDQEHNCDGVNHVIQEKDSLLEDSMVQSCHGSSVVDSSNSNNSAFADSNQHLVVDADDKVGSTSNKEDSEMQSLVCHIGAESSNDNLSTSEDDQRIMIVGIVNEKSEHLEFPNSSVTRDHVSKNDELHTEDCLLVENNIFREEPKQENILHSDKPEGVGAESESKSSGALCVIPVATLDSGSNEASLAECQMLEGTPSVPVKRKTAVENYNPDTVFQHGGSEPEKSYFNNVNSANVTSELGVCDGSGLESPHSVSPHEHMDQEHKECDGVDHVIKEKESLLGDSMVQSCHGISVVESINSSNNAFAESNQHLVVDSPKEQFGCSELQNPGNGTEEVSAENCSGLDLNEASQMDNNAESIEEGTSPQTVLQQCDSSVREPRTSSECTDVASLVQDADLDVRELKKSGSGKKKEVVIKPPPNVAPFSDEWLAAIEAAGEEILTIKSGAVQNSPPDKSQPESNPWSPVKKKTNQGIGPFDCTKCTNTNH